MSTVVIKDDHHEKGGWWVVIRLLAYFILLTRVDDRLAARKTSYLLRAISACAHVVSTLEKKFHLRLLQYGQSRLWRRSSRLGHMLVIDVGRDHHRKEEMPESMREIIPTIHLSRRLSERQMRQT